jgi:uncharacterized protein YceH (UPF0502 family)
LEIVLTDEGFRLFNPQTQEFIPSLTDAQAEAKAAQLKADAEAAKAKAAEARVAELLAEIAKLKGEV